MFWGAAIVIFLAKIIDFHNANTQGFWVEVSSQVETVMLNITIQSINRLILAFLGLFTVTGIGFIPWRVLDTYSKRRILAVLYAYNDFKEYGGFGSINERLYDCVQKLAFHNYSM